MTITYRILEALKAKGHSLDIPEDIYTDFDEWDAVFLEAEGDFDINFYCDGENYYITAYKLEYDDTGYLQRDNSDFFHVLVKELDHA
jgi:hypothetical protein